VGALQNKLTCMRSAMLIYRRFNLCARAPISRHTCGAGIKRGAVFVERPYTQIVLTIEHTMMRLFLIRHSTVRFVISLANN